MTPLTFEDARACVIQKVLAHRAVLDTERVPLLEAHGRILGEDIAADRDYPPFPRSARDGFAVRAADLPGALRIAGEVRAGERFAASVEPGTAVEIMTGAPVPDGADTVVMLEHAVVSDGVVTIERSAETGDNVSAQGSEGCAGEVLLRAGQRVDYAHGEHPDGGPQPLLQRLEGGQRSRPHGPCRAHRRQHHQQQPRGGGQDRGR